MDALINVVCPVFGIVAAGYLTGRFDVLGQDSAAALNRFVYFVAMPPLLFMFTARAPIEKIFNWPCIGALVGGGILTLLIALVLGRIWLRHDPATLSLYGFTAVFSNSGYMGIPLMIAAFGPDGALPAILASVIYIKLCVGGVVGSLETVRAVGPSTLRVISQVFGTLVRNPLLLAPLLGIVLSELALPIPKPIAHFFDLLSAAAAPGA